MRNKFSAFVIVILLLFSCSKKNKVQLVEKNFGDEIAVKTMLSFTFDDDLVPDSLTSEWNDVEYIKFEPAVEGKFHWQTARVLVFSPAGTFLPATTYSGKLTDKIFEHTKKSFKGEKQFSFHTPPLKIISSRAYWEMPGMGQAQPQVTLELTFNYDMEPSEVADLMELRLDNQEKSFALGSPNVSDKVLVTITDVKREDRDLALSMKIKKGLTPKGGTDKTSKDIEDDFEILSPFKLSISEMQANHDGSEGIITVYTSQQVDATDLRKYVTIEPDLKYSFDVQSGYFLIKSDEFSLEEKYEVTIKKGLMGVLGGELKYDYSQPVSFGEVQPTIRFVDQKEFYVSAKGSRNVQIAILNVPKVSIKITKIYENNLLAYFKNQGNYYYDEEYSDEYYDYGYSNQNIDDLGDVIYEKEVETADLPRKGANRILNFDIADKLADNKGVYVVEVRSPSDYWLRSSKMIAVTDIGLIVKAGKNNITVFANSIKTAEPLANVTINFIGNNNQLTHSTKTNSDGIALYEYGELKASGFTTSLVTAQIEGDYSVIPLNRTEINTSRFEVGGLRENESGMEAFIYGDRNLYRPGETVSLSVILRDYAWKSPGEIPIILKFNTPSGKNFKTIRKELNEQGSFDTKIELPASAMTGTYSVLVTTPNNVLVGSSIIKVEEFMPDRIKVNIELDKFDYKPGESIVLSFQSENFFGPPAAGRNYQVEVSTLRMGFYPKENNDFNYYIQGADEYFNKSNREGETDAEGKGTESFEIPIAYKNMGVLRSDVFTTVFDETGRPVNRLKSTNIYTQDVFFGLRTENYYMKTGQPVLVDLIAVNRDGKALKGVVAEVRLIRHEYKTVLSKSGDYFRYRSEEVEKLIEKKNITLNETANTYSFIPELSGNYELRITKAGVSTYVSQSIYAYGWGNTSYSSFKVNNEGQIDIQLDKAKYEVGEKAHVLLKAPFTGKILVTVERNKVMQSFYITTDKRVASFDLDLKNEMVPNVYITATLFKPHEVSDIPLTVAHGFAPLVVENTDNKMPITITAVEKSRSNTHQKVTVKSKPNTALTIAIVDEGILQVAGYATPNPYDFYYQKRALEVTTCNTYPYLFPELGMVRSTTGGDGSDMAKRLNPLQNNRVKLISYWSGILTTNSRGEATYEFDIPQFSGDLRIMAVGYDKQIFGSAEAHMKVADPLVISVALPRFLSPGDKAMVPVILTNTTSKTTKCSTSLKLEGPLQVTGQKSASVSIPPNAEAEVVYEITAKAEMGKAAITIEASALGEQFTNRTDITVRPASPLQKRSGAGVIAAGKTQNAVIDVTGFIESSTDYKLVVSKSPLVQFTKSLDYLVGYPYGCVEQTVSKAFPQIYFSDLLGVVYKQKRATDDAMMNVQIALDRIKLMQLYSGALTYWPGEGYETWWGSVYAAHFTLEAKKAGYEVDQSFLDQLLKYIKSKLNSKETFTYYYNYNQKKEIAPKEVAYSLYVLCLAGEKPTSLLNYYRTHLDQLSLDSKYLLAASYALCGDKQKYKEILPPAFEGEKSNSTFGGSFYSYIRDEAIALNVLLDVDPDNKQVGVMAKHISEQLMNARYLNTQERTFGFLAMGKIARIAAASDVKATIQTDGKTIGQMDNNTVSYTKAQLKNSSVSIATQGNGKLYYFWESEGMTADGSYVKEDSYLKVRKQFYNQTGNTTVFKLNDLVLVELSITGLTTATVENIALTDILPACFEIENPRLTILPPGMKFPHTQSSPEYLDIRDDRINLFVSAAEYTYYYYYLLRVVSAGTYIMGPVSADAMYNGEYHSYNGDGVIVVERK